MLEITKTRTTPSSPKSDGMVERFNRTLIDQLAKTLLDCGGDVAIAYNTSVHASTQFTPYFPATGREARGPAGVLIPTRAIESQMSMSHTVCLVITEEVESCLQLPCGGVFVVVNGDIYSGRGGRM